MIGRPPASANAFDDVVVGAEQPDGTGRRAAVLHIVVFRVRG